MRGYNPVKDSDADLRTKQRLVDFETDIEKLYNEGKIRTPVHLSGGNELQLIKIFKEIKPDDWVFSTHRSHYHAILKGVDENVVREKILNNESMHLFDIKYNFFTSSIVGGIVPIAVGVALGNKLKKYNSKVWVFVGDMCAEMGVFEECVKYSARNNLNIEFIIEDNGISVNTPTDKAWGTEIRKPDVWRYCYERKYPHVGTGKWVNF